MAPTADSKMPGCPHIRCSGTLPRVGQRPFGVPLLPEMVNGIRSLPSRDTRRVSVALRPKACLVQCRPQPGPELARWIEASREEPPTCPHAFHYAIQKFGRPTRHRPEF